MTSQSAQEMILVAAVQWLGTHHPLLDALCSPCCRSVGLVPKIVGVLLLFKLPGLSTHSTFQLLRAVNTFDIPTTAPTVAPTLAPTMYFNCSQQFSALKDLYHSTHGVNWKRRINWWNGDPTFRRWTGISATCLSGAACCIVNSLYLPDNNLVGRFICFHWLSNYSAMPWPNDSHSQAPCHPRWELLHLL